jgi:hypothetical protein
VTTAQQELFFATAGTRTFDDPSSGAVKDDSIFSIYSQSKMIASVRYLIFLAFPHLILSQDRCLPTH